MFQWDYFNDLYTNNPDPWHYQTRWYEARKRMLTLASLPQRGYTTAIELGCGNGVFSESLAERCQQLLCLDGNPQAVQLAEQRLQQMNHVTVQHAIVPQNLPEQMFDLIVIGEMLYYLAPQDIHTVIVWIKAHLATNGTLLCCHWRYPIAGFEHSGETVHQLLKAELDTPASGLFSQLELNDTDFLLNVWQKRRESVAQLEGLR